MDAARRVITWQRVLVLVMLVGMLMGVLVVLYLVLVLGWMLVGMLVGVRMVAVCILDKVARGLGTLWVGRVLASAGGEGVRAGPRRGGVV